MYFELIVYLYIILHMFKRKPEAGCLREVYSNGDLAYTSPSQAGQAQGSYAEAYRREALPVYTMWGCLCSQLRPEEPHARTHRPAPLSVLKLL